MSLFGVCDRVFSTGTQPRQSRGQNSDCLAQRRKGRKGRKGNYTSGLGALGVPSTFAQDKLGAMTKNQKIISRKDAKHAKFGETEKYFFFALLAPWREKISWSGSVKHSKR